VTQDFQRIPGVAAAAIGEVGDEPTFAFPEVLEVVKLCSANQIAVLGVELFLVKPDGYYASGCSAYELYEKQRWSVVRLTEWPEYVRYNNALAEEFTRRNPLGDDHVYVLTTSSWREFCEIQLKKQSL
jgi:hypothetical protein